MTKGKCIIFSAPSGAGKTTIVRALLEKISVLDFSISACSRSPRPNEKNGIDYYFLSIEEFRLKIEEDAFIEWEEVYPNHLYGTLKSEIERIWEQNKVVIFDVDVHGGINLKKFFDTNALSIFVEPPSIEELENRLKNRKTENSARIETRINKAKQELKLKNQFDFQLLNDDLVKAIEEAHQAISTFIEE